MSEIALIGKKIGMTREFYKSGQSVPVTVLKMETGRVIQVIEQEKRGYKAVQIGFGKIKNNKLSKAMKGFFAKKNTEPKKILKEEEFEVEFFKEYNLKMTVIKNKIIGHINDKVIIEVEDDDSPFLKGGAGLVVDNGTLVTEQIILN